MGQNKFEKELREKLNAREIMPSDKAWDRLDAMLAVAEEKQSKRSYGWLYIAAAILGFVFIGTFFFSQTEALVDKGHDNVVLENALEEHNGAKEEILPAVEDSQAIASAEPSIKSESSNRAGNQYKQNQSSIKKQINAVEAINEVPDNQKLIASNESTVNQNQSTTNQKTEQSLKVDELLAAAQNQQVHPKTSVKVNAKSLLSEVDQQVNLSFREKMLRRAGEVAEVVANRNNE